MSTKNTLDQVSKYFRLCTNTHTHLEVHFHYINIINECDPSNVELSFV